MNQALVKEAAYEIGLGSCSKAEQFWKLQLLNDEFHQNTNFAKLSSAQWLFLYNVII